MKLEDQVCNKELAVKLKELGVKQESYFYWANYFPDEEEGWFKSEEFIVTQIPYGSGDRPDDLVWFAAPSVAELGQILPAGYVSRRKDHGLRWACDNLRSHPKIVYADREADARAKMLVYLISNNLMEVPK